MSLAEVAAVIAALTALVTALVALVRELRAFRSDVVKAVEAHMVATVAATEESGHHTQV